MSDGISRAYSESERRRIAEEWYDYEPGEETMDAELTVRLKRQAIRDAAKDCRSHLKRLDDEAESVLQTLAGVRERCEHPVLVDGICMDCGASLSP